MKLHKHDKQYGLHSGIPECCVNYYIGEWTTRELKFRKQRVKNSADFCYIPCDSCLLKNKPSEIHACSLECIDFLVDEMKFSFKRIYTVIFVNMMQGLVPLPNKKYLKKTVCYISVDRQ